MTEIVGKYFTITEAAESAQRMAKFWNEDYRVYADGKLFIVERGWPRRKHALSIARGRNKTTTGNRKLKMGQKVLAPAAEGEGQRRLLTVASRETHNHQEFYRVEEIPGALFLSKSLVRT